MLLWCTTLVSDSDNCNPYIGQRVPDLIIIRDPKSEGFFFISAAARAVGLFDVQHPKLRWRKVASCYKHTDRWKFPLPLLLWFTTYSISFGILITMIIILVNSSALIIIRDPKSEWFFPPYLQLLELLNHSMCNSLNYDDGWLLEEHRQVKGPSCPKLQDVLVL